MIDLKSGNFYLIKRLSDNKTDIINVTIVKGELPTHDRTNGLGFRSHHSN